jgi:hypothetical protein
MLRVRNEFIDGLATQQLACQGQLLALEISPLPKGDLQGYLTYPVCLTIHDRSVLKAKGLPRIREPWSAPAP